MHTHHDNQKLIMDNFKYKNIYITNRIKGMTAIETPDYVKTDCGLPSDTFNNITLLQASHVSHKELVKEIQDYNAKKFPMGLWFWDEGEEVNSGIVHLLEGIGLVEAEINMAMRTNLNTIKPITDLPEGFTIREVSTSSDIRLFGDVLSSLFGESQEARSVQLYYELISSLPLWKDSNYKLYIGTYQDTVVSTGSLVLTQESMGIYDIATREEARGLGFGTAMFHYLLKEAKKQPTETCVLLASLDGIGIYTKAGFEAVGQIKVYENRHLVE